MTHAITVGYDGSPTSARALTWAADIAARDGATLELVSCFTTPGVIDPWYVGIPIDMERIRTNVEGTLASAADRLRSEHPGLQLETTAVWGSPRSELVAQAADSDLLVVGTTGAGAAASWLLGSVARAVARTSPCPVALVPDIEPGEPTGCVVVGVDGSPASDRALDWAVDEADARGADLEVLHAWLYEYTQESTAAAGRELLQVDAARVLDRSVERARERARCAVRGTLVEGPAAASIVDAAETADLVVVGSRGRGGLRSTLFGSVAQRVVGESARPVVVVRCDQ